MQPWPKPTSILQSTSPDHRETPEHRDAIHREALEINAATTAAASSEAAATAARAAEVASVAEGALIDATMSGEADAIAFAEASVSATATAAATAALANSTAKTAAANAQVRLTTELNVSQSGQRIAGCDESCGWIWESSRALEAALLGAVAASTRSDFEQLRCLELGSGTGWLALRLAQLGADVTVTDRVGATTLLQRNVMRNQEAFRAAGADETALRVECLDLTWEDTAEADSGGEGDAAAWDWIVGSDLLYVHESHLPLLQTLRRHAGPRTRCMLAWQERKLAEEAHFVHELVPAAGFTAEWLRDTEGGGGQRLWVMCLSRVRSG